jgi:thiamine monophosphate kinase
MARVRSTARVSHEEDDAETTDIAPISEMMRRSGLVISEKAISEDEAVEVEQIAAEDRSDDEGGEDYSILSLSKPSHIEFGKSNVTAENMVMMKKLGYFGEAESKLVRFAGEEVIPESKEDEVVVFKSFFRAGLRSICMT